MKNNLDRRDFLKGMALAATGLPLIGTRVFAAQTPAKSATTIYVVHGKKIPEMLRQGMAKLGGWKAFVKAGKNAVLKPNAAWPSKPEQGGNTDPVLVGECVAGCLAAGAAEVVIPENTCTDAATAFSRSGVEQAVKKAGGRIYAPKKDQYEKATLPDAKILKQADIVKDVLHADCLVNIPVAKDHVAVKVTAAMKNWMGSVRDRGYWHTHGLPQCIADFSSFIKPSLTILDATRILLTNGPRGPGKLAYPAQIVLGRDPVAIDAYATTLFKLKPFDVPYIKIAHDMGIGCGDLSKVNIVHINT